MNDEFCRALKRLKLNNLSFKNERKTIHYLKTMLPNCDVIYGTDGQ